MSETITGPVGNNVPAMPFMSLELLQELAAESAAYRVRADAERNACMATLRAPDESAGALLTELRGHFERASCWTCDMHDHQGRANEIIDILAARATPTEELETAS